MQNLGGGGASRGYYEQLENRELNEEDAASFPVVLGDFGCDVTCQACRVSRSDPSLLRPLGYRKQAWVRG